ncbi:MAG: PRC-barrel domain-containing protein [Xanthobacteraceae bacterium]
MRNKFPSRTVAVVEVVVVILTAVSAFAAAFILTPTPASTAARAENVWAQNAQPPAQPPAAKSPAPTQAPEPAPPPAAVTILPNHEVQGVLGREVLSSTGEDMGRIVDVLVDRGGQVRAAIIDFGGFLGVGSRKIAVEWNALRFPADAKISLELTRDQVKAAPEYQDGKPVVVLGALGKLEPLPFQ